MQNMYVEMTEKNINPLRGECSHKCSYCYVNKLKKTFPNMKKKYSGSPMLDEKVLSSKVKGGTRFLCSCNDLFASDVSNEDITRILIWAVKQDGVTWWIQTKNPSHPLFTNMVKSCPRNFRLGITLETNWPTRSTSNAPSISNAPNPIMRTVPYVDYVTIEPIMMFDRIFFVKMMKAIYPNWINIGADSGNNNLPEPTEKEIVQLVNDLKGIGYDVRLKPNLERLAPSLFEVK